MCTDCHASHQLEIIDDCGCHGSFESLQDIRWNTTPDYNGNGDTTEGVYYEIMGLADDVYAGMQAYSTAHPDTDEIVYDSHSYPYWFNSEGGRYSTWTPRLARAAYNYQYAQKDPGGICPQQQVRRSGPVRQPGRPGNVRLR